MCVRVRVRVSFVWVYLCVRVRALHTHCPSTHTAPWAAIIRSKGFVWVANQHRSAQYWSHAGHYFELRALGLWWTATALDQWPDQGQSDSKEVCVCVCVCICVCGSGRE